MQTFQSDLEQSITRLKSSRIRTSIAPVGLQCIMLVIFVGWQLLDPYAEPMMTIAAGGIRSFQWSESKDLMIAIAGSLRFNAFIVAVIAFLAVNFWMLVQHVRLRRYALKQLMITTGLVALWCASAIGWQQITWSGKRMRAAGRLEALDRLAVSLHEDWPQSDGEIEGLGPFNAYPWVRPSVLLLLTPYPLEGTNTVIAAIERSPQGSLRFQLGGEDGGDWIEWHDGNRIPDSFTGGLRDRHQLQRFSRIGSEWYLVRYSEAVAQSS
ncbi:hypothetical protein U8335_26285 [Roseiconus lacunae]|uniref:hypothetical protein n=1 Tax=Roseiconus lacunae TaxID=2605694 RepID=UPI003092C6FB|nr:hypothetical protein U8335_26285 [Stieleria sp. HD01]